MQSPSTTRQMLTSTTTWALLLLGVCLGMTLATPIITADADSVGSAEGGHMAIDLALLAPSRPNIFRNPDELRTYLEALSNYYAIAGRPRFGKRNGGRFHKRPISWVMSTDGEDTSGLLARFRSGY